MSPFTVIYTEPESDLWQGFNCMADDSDHAVEQCENAYPACEVVWVNTGHNNFSQD